MRQLIDRNFPYVGLSRDWTIKFHFIEPIVLSLFIYGIFCLVGYANPENILYTSVMSVCVFLGIEICDGRHWTPPPEDTAEFFGLLDWGASVLGSFLLAGVSSIIFSTGFSIGDLVWVFFLIWSIPLLIIIPGNYLLGREIINRWNI